MNENKKEKYKQNWFDLFIDSLPFDFIEGITKNEQLNSIIDKAIQKGTLTIKEQGILKKVYDYLSEHLSELPEASQEAAGELLEKLSSIFEAV